MRKFCFLLSCILILQLFAGCSRKDDEILKPVNFYYINKEISYNTQSGVISPEIREGAQFHSLDDLLKLYMEGPASENLQSLFPDGVSLLSCAVENETAYIYLSSDFAELSGIKLTTVCSAMLLTARDYAGIQEICVRAENAKLDDKDEFLLSLDEIVLMDTVVSEETKE